MTRCINATTLLLLVIGLGTFLLGYPISEQNRRALKIPDFSLTGTQRWGKIRRAANFVSPIDKDTPETAKTKKGHDGNNYHLVFSDEFNTDNRSFHPGNDPYWEAVDFNYWPTGDLEWYDPSAATTKNGKLVITMTEAKKNNFNYTSAMLTTWNKWCFTTGIIEVSISLPGDAQTPGFWPGAWTMGNLGRAGYGGTTDGTWPYTYDSCDVGTLPNQTYTNGNPKSAHKLSSLPGQRLSACTCPGSDHPGPSVKTGRGAPEIDILEAQINTTLRKGMVSQSFQVAPYNYQYQFNNASPATTIYDDSRTKLNEYKGGPYQQALSALTLLDSANYGGNGYGTYGFEWWSDPKHRDQGYITWTTNNTPTWSISSSSIGIDPTTQVNQRLISEEPHYILLNLGMAPGFQEPDFKNLKFPAQMFVDYVRVYQKDGVNNVGCNPKDHPTADYIRNHPNAYTNSSFKTWAEAGYASPRNSLNNCSS